MVKKITPDPPFSCSGKPVWFSPQSTREITFQKNSYFPHVSGMGEYCVRQTSGLLFKCRCKFSDAGFAARLEKAHSAA